jgi:hypothetical protein
MPSFILKNIATLTAENQFIRQDRINTSFNLKEAVDDYVIAYLSNDQKFFVVMLAGRQNFITTGVER